MHSSKRQGVYITTLGCPKNIVDSRHLREMFLKKGIPVFDSPEEAGAIIINTCGFIKDAKKESIEEILRHIEFKKDGKKIIVYGCLAQRYRDELKNEIPEIDMIFGINEEEKIIEGAIKTLKILPERAKPSPYRASATPYEYIKISDGCNRKCTFCAIPSIKGKMKSIRPDIILKEAESLIKEGVKELIIVGQDITSYGKDTKGFPSLIELLRELTTIKGDFWLRLMYLYPTGIDDKLIEEIRENPKICKYLDIPIQHSEERILRLMNRPASKEFYRSLIKRIRSIIPDIALRTSIIVGFPGETYDDFNALKDFIKEMEFDHLGAFIYSEEEGTPAVNIKGKVSESIKKRRYDELMRLQAEISLKKNLKLIGKKLRCLIDDVDGAGFGRLERHAPEIDGMVIVKGNELKKGEFVDVIIKKAYDYDLEAEVL